MTSNIDPSSSGSTGPVEPNSSANIPADSGGGAGGFHFTQGRTWLGMQFTGEQWTKLMNIMLQNVASEMRKEQAKAIAAIKKLRKSETGEGDDN